MSKKLGLAERVVVFPRLTSGPGGAGPLQDKLLRLSKSLGAIGKVVVAVNYQLKGCGFGLIDGLHNHGVEVLADLKINLSNSAEMLLEADLLAPYEPEMVTIAGQVEDFAIKGLRELLPLSQIFASGSNDQKLWISTLTAMQVKLDGFVSLAPDADISRFQGQRRQVYPDFEFVVGASLSGPSTPSRMIRTGADRVVLAISDKELASAANMVEKAMIEIERSLATEEAVETI